MVVFFQTKKASRKSKKRQPQSPDMDQINTSSDCGSLPTPSTSKQQCPPKTHVRPSRKNKNKKNSGDEEKTFVKSMAKTINNMNDMVSNKNPQDEHDMWAKLLATKVRRMDQDKGDQFKLRVDTLAFEYLK